jgi:methylmalonyl-CoA/ethylmalonyl-CoA epimerase
MIQKIDHLGIVVRSIDEAIDYYEKVLGLSCKGREEVPVQKVRTAFFLAGEVRLELIEPTSTDSPVAKYLEKHGEGLHHVGFATDDIIRQLQQAKQAGCNLIDETPVKGAGGKLVAFLHPKSTHGVLTEFCSADAKKS